MLFSSLVAILACTSAAFAAPSRLSERTVAGSIIQPANGTTIKPGQSFNFQYQPMSDYGVSSYNFTVYLFTQLPTGFASTQQWADAHYFGRYSLPNYPGEHSAVEPLRRKLTIFYHRQPEPHQHPSRYPHYAQLFDKPGRLRRWRKRF
jgi:hypothetical protein